MKREKTVTNLIRYSLAGYLACFMFNTGVHENTVTFVICSFAANTNLIAFYGLSGQSRPYVRLAGIDATVWLSMLNLGLFAAYYLTAIRDDDARTASMPAV